MFLIGGRLDAFVDGTIDGFDNLAGQWRKRHERLFVATCALLGVIPAELHPGHRRGCVRLRDYLFRRSMNVTGDYKPNRKVCISKNRSGPISQGRQTAVRWLQRPPELRCAASD